MAVPTFTELYTSVQTDLRNRLGISTLVGKMVLNAFAAVQAGKLKIYYLLSAFIYKNIFPDTADSAEIGGTLERFGLVYLGRRPNPAVAGEYKIQVSGDVGATIAPSTTFKSLDTSASPDRLFILDTLFTFTSATGIIDVRSLDLGTDAVLNVGDQLQVTAPIANVDSFSEVTSVVVTPVESEDIETYRELVIQAIQLEAQGGAKTDYRIWAADAAGVRKVYPYVKNLFSGTVQLYVEANPADSTDGNGTPSASILSDVEDVIEFDPDISKPLTERGRRPMTVTLEVLSINTISVDVDIVDLSDTSYLTTIEDAIIDLLFYIRPFIDGADNQNDSNTDLLYVSDIINTIRDVLGNNASFTNITVDVDGSPITTLYEFTDGDIPFLDNLTNS